jgi:hypothetical protein
MLVQWAEGEYKVDDRAVIFPSVRIVASGVHGIDHTSQLSVEDSGGAALETTVRPLPKAATTTAIRTTLGEAEVVSASMTFLKATQKEGPTRQSPEA